jgi:preflagellin peptidase FlaK
VRPLNPLDITRILFSLVMLSYTSWIDLRTREIYDLIWVVFSTIGLLINLYEVYVGTLTLLGLAFPVLFSVILSAVFGYIGLFGGADVEAFIALALLQPFPPRCIEPALGVVSVIYPLTLFSNSALAGASFALFLLVRNIMLAITRIPLFEFHGSDPWWKKLVVMFTGIRVGLDSVRGPPFQYPLELPPEEGDSMRRLIILPDIHDDEAAWEIFRQLKREGAEEVWVSNTLPFLVFIAIGYISALLFGDIALSVLSRFLFR